MLITMLSTSMFFIPGISDWEAGSVFAWKNALGADYEDYINGTLYNRYLNNASECSGHHMATNSPSALFTFWTINNS